MRTTSHSPVGRFTALAAASALAACSSGVGERPEIKPAAAYASPVSLQAPAADWPKEDWWSAYGDPQLTALIQEGLRGAPDIAIAAARLAKAGADQARAEAAWGLSVEGNGSAYKLKQSYNLGIPPEFVPVGYQPTGRASIDASYDLDLWGKNHKAFAAASSDYRATEAEAAEARLILSTAIAQAYSDLRRLLAERDLAVQSSDLRRQSAILVSSRTQNGIENRVAQNEAEAQTPAALAEQAALDEEIAAARNRIAALVGAGPDRGLAVHPPPSAKLPAFGLPPSVGAELVGRRPDVVASRWRVEAAAKRIGAARAAFFPNIDLTAYIGRQALPIDLFSHGGSSIGQVGGAINLPIFGFGTLKANYRGARADYDLAVANYDGAVTEAFRQVADVVAAQRSLAIRSAQTRQALASNEEALRLAQLRYGGGLEPYASVLRVQDAVIRSRRASVDLDARAFQLDIQLIRALGGASIAR